MVELVDGSLQFLGQQVHFLKVFRLEGIGVTYELTDDTNVRIIKNGAIHVVNRAVIRNHAEQLLNLIRNSENSIDVTDPKIGQLKTLLLTDRLSAKSSDKSDFTGEVVSPGQAHSHTLVFSVKSHLGGRPTLVNANKENSLFHFEIVATDGHVLNEKDRQTLAEIQTRSEKGNLKIKPRIKLLQQHGYNLSFRHTSAALDYTLRIIDSRFPEILAEILAEHYNPAGKTRSIAGIVDDVCCRYKQFECLSGLGLTEEEVRTSVQYKMQNFLLAFSTGATVSTKWDGKDLANGGFIVVMQDDQVVCIELFTRNSIGRYLLENTKFDTPSTRRHNGGRIDLSGDKPMFGLQLQVRFNGN